MLSSSSSFSYSFSEERCVEDEHEEDDPDCLLSARIHGISYVAM